MNRITWLVICACCFLITMSSAGVETFEVNYTYYLGDNETKLNAQEVALRYAEREALERAGVYIESITVVRDYELTMDEIKAYTAGMVELVNRSGEWAIEGANFVYNLTAWFRIDTDDVARQIEKISGESELENRLKESYEEIDRLYAELDRVQADQKIIVSNAIRASYLYEEVYDIILNCKYEYAEKALSMSREAFELEPYDDSNWQMLADSYILLYNSHLTSKTEKDIIREIWLEAQSKDDVGLWFVLARYLESSMNLQFRGFDSLSDIGYNGNMDELYIYSCERGLSLSYSNKSVYDVWPFIDMLTDFYNFRCYDYADSYEKIIELVSLGLKEGGTDTDLFYIYLAYIKIIGAYIDLENYDTALKYAYEAKDFIIINYEPSKITSELLMFDWLIETIKSRM